MQLLGASDVGLLSALRAASKKDDQRLTVLGEIDPVARAPVDPQFPDPGELLDA